MVMDTPPGTDKADMDSVFVAPSVEKTNLLSGVSYSHFSPVPKAIQDDMGIECVLGVDEAGRGPVLGPMVYGVFYLPLPLERQLLAKTHHFDDSKVLSVQVRSDLMEKLCTPSTDLYESCGWATKVMSARDISAGMLRPSSTHNLNAQAMDATIELIKGVFALGINIKEIYIDTIGPPQSYQNKLSKIFPTTSITVAKKADSLYPCVSAASVCAKVTRDVSLELCYEEYALSHPSEGEGWGSGYPSDARCSSWLRRTMDPVFGWGNECRFSWGTAKDLLEVKGSDKVDWPVDDSDETSMRVTDFFTSSSAATEQSAEGDEMCRWFGSRVEDQIFSFV
ncbi:MAG: hypothetical protein M1829_000069 [Trizodia sp. TS-e1964]|nr:MAG: hypothetical protein M1829_000069 [Trizodia sp. TS-e1964]